MTRLIIILGVFGTVCGTGGCQAWPMASGGLTVGQSHGTVAPGGTVVEVDSRSWAMVAVLAGSLCVPVLVVWLLLRRRAGMPAACSGPAGQDAAAGSPPLVATSERNVVAGG